MGYNEMDKRSLAKSRFFWLIMLFYMVIGATVSVKADVVKGVSYVYYETNGTTLVKKSGTQDCTVVTSSDTEWEPGWYVVSSDVTIDNNHIYIIGTGTVNLILCDGATLRVNGTNHSAGFTVMEEETLNIYGQSGGTGSLVAIGGNATDGGGAGIGADRNEGGGTITINGGIITAIGDGGGIGGGSWQGGSTVTINGGRVIATGDGGAGIGGGQSGAGATVTINGGNIIAQGEDGASGIGGGYQGDGGTVTINGGTVTATGEGHKRGAGIGGGNLGAGGTVTINGGTVTAIGGWCGAGIGGGYHGAGGTFTINGGMVTARGGDYGAGIGGGDDGAGGIVKINGGYVKATGGTNAMGIGHGDNETINGKLNLGSGMVLETSENGSSWTKTTDTTTRTLYMKAYKGYTVTFNANGHGTAPSAQIVAENATATKPADPPADGYTFGGWYTEAGCTNAYDFSTAVTADITLYAKWTEDQEKISIAKTPKVKRAKAKKRKVTVTWNRIKKNKNGKKLLKKIRYIQVQYSTDPTFTIKVKSKKVGKKKMQTVLKLHRKTVYYIRVRYVAKDGGFSNWSNIKRVKTR